MPGMAHGLPKRAAWRDSTGTRITLVWLIYSSALAEKLEKLSSTSSLTAHCGRRTGIAYQDERRPEEGAASRII